MTLDDQSAENYMMLLTTLELEEAVEAVAAICGQKGQPKAIAVVIFDPDLEIFADKHVFGPRKKDFINFIENLSYETWQGLKPDVSKCSLFELNGEDFNGELNPDLLPVYCYVISQSNNLCACLFIAKSTISASEIEAHLNDHPLHSALTNTFEVREIKRENERLRQLYDELEAKNRFLEEQTRKLIYDTETKDALRTRHVQREKLLYEISNAVRSSLEIRDVLQNAVDKIGITYDLSRCLLFKRVITTDEISVYEYNSTESNSVVELLHTEKGKEFMQAALSKKTAHYFFEIDFDSEINFDPNFLRQLKVVSGLLVPLIAHNYVLGAIFLQDCKEQRHWTIEQTAFLESLADQLSVAIENADLHEEKKLQAVTDALTNLPNRRHFNDAFQKEFGRAKRYSEPLSLILVDLDLLKKINDTYGHGKGDEAIKAIGNVMSKSCRSVDLPARIGGEEFCLLLPNTDVEMAANLAERLRKLIEETSIPGIGNITASIGVSNFPIHASEMSELMAKADEALYVAKRGGRNRVAMADKSNK